MNNNYNSLVFAYIGDAIYEVKVRNFLVHKNIPKVNELQHEALNYVSAKRQAYFLDKLLQDNFFSLEEQEIIKHARNSKTNSKPKNCDILTYKHATALESITGYFYLNNMNNRIDEMFEKIINL